MRVLNESSADVAGSQGGSQRLYLHHGMDAHAHACLHSGSIFMMAWMHMHVHVHVHMHMHMHMHVHHLLGGRWPRGDRRERRGVG